MSKVTGADGIAKAFKAVTLNLKTPIQQASRKALKPVLDAAKANLTPSHGVETGKLKKLLTIKPDPKNKASMHVGPDARDPHYRVGHLVEFGTAPHDIDGKMHPGAKARPFLAPAFEEKSDAALEIFGKENRPSNRGRRKQSGIKGDEEMTTSIQLTRALLLADIGVKTVVANRVYVAQIPQDAAVPCIVLQVVWDEPEYQLAGTSPARNSRIRVECITKTASATDFLAGVVSEALIDIANQSIVVDGHKLTDSVTVWQLGTYESDVGDDRQYYRVILEFRLRWLQ